MGRTVVPEQTVILQNVEHTTHLTKDQYARALGFQVPEKLVKDDHLAGVLDQVLVGCVGRARFLEILLGAGQEIGMRTYRAVEEVGMASDWIE